MSSLRDWLQANGLERHSDNFHANGIDLDVIASLTNADLRELGLNLGDRKRFLAAVSDGAHTASALAALSTTASTEAERRQLTVMFCDLVGSTKLSQELDPEELRRLIRQYQDVCAGTVTRYDGHVAQFLGDGVLVYFGYPKAHEGEAERAIRAALAIIENVGELSTDHQLQVRIGIDSGLVVIGQGEALNEQERTAIGDAPNVAARLQGFAKPGTIVISERSRQLAGGAFDYADLGRHELKGISEPLRAWQITGEKAVETRFDAATGGKPAPMVGRETEMSVALQAWAQGKSGKQQVLLLCGEPGIGKSRIVRAIRERLKRDGAQAWQYQCSPFFANTALYPVVSNIERAVGFGRNESPESKLAKLEAFLKEGFATPDLDLNLIGRLFNLPVDEKYGSLSMTPQKQKDETIRALVDVGQIASERNPMLILYEDVHWSDPTTIEMLDSLLKRKAMRALVVITYRPEFTPPWIGQPQVTQMTLNRLDADQTEQVATRVAGNKRLPKEIIEQIIQKTDGIPLFVEELTKAILETDIIKEQGDEYVLNGPLTTLAIPATLHDSLMARLDRLEPTKEAAQIGACIGREFSHELLSLVSTQGTEQLVHAVAQLLASELVFQRGKDEDAVYAFKHALVQDAAYESLLKSKRVEIHAKIAATLETHFPETINAEPETLAHHYTAASLFDKAIPYWLKAGQTAVRRTAFLEAAVHLKKGLELLEGLPQSAQRDHQELDFLSVLMPVHITLTGWSNDELHRIASRARVLGEQFGEIELLTGVWEVLWMVQSCGAKLPESLKVATQAIEAGKAMKQTGFKVIGYFGSTLSQGWMGHFRESLEAARQTVENYDFERHSRIVFATNHDPLASALSWASHFYWVAGFPDQARHAAVQQVELARRLNHPFQLIWSLVPGAGAFMYRGESKPFFEWMREATRIAEEQALGFALDMIVGVFGGMGLVWFGHFEEGYEKIKRGTELFVASGNRIVIPMFQTAMSDALGKMGRVEEGLTLIGCALDQIAETSEGFYEAEAHRIRGGLLLLEGQPAQAETAFQASLAIARAQSAKGWELRSAMSLARLWQQQGKNKEAHDLLEPVYSWFTEGFDTKDLKEAKALLEELEVTA